MDLDIKLGVARLEMSRVSEDTNLERFWQANRAKPLDCNRQTLKHQLSFSRIGCDVSNFMTDFIYLFIHSFSKTWSEYKTMI